MKNPVTDLTAAFLTLKVMTSMRGLNLEKNPEACGRSPGITSSESPRKGLKLTSELCGRPSRPLPSRGLQVPPPSLCVRCAHWSLCLHALNFCPFISGNQLFLGEGEPMSSVLQSTLLGLVRDPETVRAGEQPGASAAQSRSGSHAQDGAPAIQLAPLRCPEALQALVGNCLAVFSLKGLVYLSVACL